MLNRDFFGFYELHLERIKSLAHTPIHDLEAAIIAGMTIQLEIITRVHHSSQVCVWAMSMSSVSSPGRCSSCGSWQLLSVQAWSARVAGCASWE